MKKSSNFGLLLLAIWLILTGLEPFLRVNIPNQSVIISLLAVAAVLSKPFDIHEMLATVYRFAGVAA
jgi:Flp pilus assembly protein protease CpaA